MSEEPQTIARVIQSFEEAGNGDLSRFKSWNFCYDYFQSGAVDADHGALHLTAYLASWGMYRGSGFLLEKNYHVHIPAIGIITDPKYQSLNNASCATYASAENVDLLFDLIKSLKDYYTPYGKDLTKGNVVSPTDTLATKILLGTLACVPAYDSFFVNGLRTQETNNGKLTYSKLLPDNFVKMIRFCAGRADFQSSQYPEMKMIDMYFWQQGKMFEDAQKQAPKHKPVSPVFNA